MDIRRTSHRHPPLTPHPPTPPKGPPVFTPPTPVPTAPSSRSQLATVLAATLAFAALLTGLLAAVPASAAPGVAASAAAESGGRVFYVDPSRGNDSASGSKANPWRTLTRASQADLRPGDTLRLAVPPPTAAPW